MMPFFSEPVNRRRAQLNCWLWTECWITYSVLKITEMILLESHKGGGKHNVQLLILACNCRKSNGSIKYWSIHHI